MERCRPCYGSGFVPEIIQCEPCDGLGTVNGGWQDCGECKATGIEIVSVECSRCHGTGDRPTKEEIAAQQWEHLAKYYAGEENE